MSDATPPLKTLLILGGSPQHPGGIEAFCDRARQALEKRGGWQIETIPANTAYFKMGGLPALIRGIRGLARHRKQRPDCLWLQYGNMPDLIYLVIAKMFGMRIMVTPHLGSNWKSQSSPLLRSLSGWALGRAHRLALISWTQETEINLPESLPRSLIRNFLPNEILTAALPSPDGAEPKLQLIHSGRLSRGKGSLMVVDACARLRDANVPFFARITGAADAETYRLLAKMIADYGLEDHVAVLGRVSETDLLNHLRNSDVLVHLSKIDSYPLIVLEAMACAIVPVVMELAGARDMVETYDGHVVSQAGAIDETVAWLAAQTLPDIRHRGRAAAAEVRTDYAWDRCAGALDEALRACIAGSRQEEVSKTIDATHDAQVIGR
jgi:glycosyltransferase involved in cell wall biosynthesis